MGLSGWDKAYPLRFCPTDQMTIVAANAHARDGLGCMLWKGGTKVLRLEMRYRSPPEGASLLTNLPELGAP